MGGNELMNLQSQYPVGSIVKYHKYDSKKKSNKGQNKDKNNTYLYKIIGYATDLKTENEVVVYEALYRSGKNFGLFTRPVDDFYSTIKGSDGNYIKKFTIFDPDKD